MEYEDTNDKLANAKQLFEDSVDHTVNAHIEAHRAARFYANSECEGQWEAEDLEYLRTNDRVAFTFNVIKPKVDTFLGMYADAQRIPQVAPAGGEDTLLADVVNMVKDQILQDANYETLAGRQLKTGTVQGECAIQVEVEESDEGPGWIQVNLYRVMPYEIHWDIGSMEPDHSDARYVFWDRWFSKAEFQHAYPEHADKWGEYAGNAQSYEGVDDANDGWGEVGIDNEWRSGDYDGTSDRYFRYYYDRKKHKMRVVRYEYKTFRTQFYAHDMQTGERSKIDEQQVEQVRYAEQQGVPVQLVESKEEVVEVCEFVGNAVLSEYDNAGPFEGFSLVSYCYDIDEETGTAFGYVRNLFDPQQEVNKSKSLEIEHMAQSTAVGVIAEQGEIPDKTAFSAELKKAGGIAEVKKGALSTKSVTERVPSPPNQAGLVRTQGAMDLLNEISAIPSVSNLTAAEHQQAGSTVAIRYHKSRQSVSTPFSHFEDAQRQIIAKVAEAIMTAMPDDQIAAVLASDDSYIVQNGVVVEMGPAPDGSGQMVPKRRAEIRSLREMRWSLDMEFASENSTLRLIELEILLQLATVNVPVDPDVLVELASSSRSTRERLKTYVEQAQAAQQAGAQSEQMALQQQSQQYAQLEAGKLSETQRHNQMTEALKAQEQSQRVQIEAAKVWERAETDAEKLELEERMALWQRTQPAVQGGRAYVQ